MDKVLSAADANRKFSLILRHVRAGASYVVTSHGKPVARIVPVAKHEEVVAAARAELLARLEREPLVEGEHWTRDELYEDDP
jgi:prevent-host-death family protein